MEKVKKWIWNNKGTIVFIAIILFLRLNHVFVVNIVRGDSMLSTLHSGQICLGSSLAEYERGDIVVAKLDKTEIIKRIIGLPGDNLKYVDGVFYVNGEKLDESYLDEEYNQATVGNFEVTLQDDEYFICGDNRGNSFDSRYFGPLKAENLLEKIYVK